MVQVWQMERIFDGGPPLLIVFEHSKLKSPVSYTGSEDGPRAGMRHAGETGDGYVDYEAVGCQCPGSLGFDAGT